MPLCMGAILKMMNRKMSNRTRRCMWTVLCIILLGTFVWWNNSVLTESKVTVEAAVESEIRILHLSDLHGTWFGKDQSRIVRAAERFKPDVIVVTGDMIDQIHDSEAAFSLIERMAAIAPTCCVTGNHEEMVRRSGSGEYEALLAVIERTENAYLLRGETMQLSEGVSITGADDIPFAGGTSNYRNYISGISKQKDENFSILLAHRPEMHEYYAAAGFDLTLSGHAHGGQIRLPFVGGLLAPGQGILPEYDGGLYRIAEDAQMYVSRGLGNSVFPFRIFNQPELVMIVISPKE